jgi:histidinol-phosphate aminotransferase
VVFPNPNAPTGAFLSLEVVEDIIQHNQDVVVIVDEAYIDFGGDTAKELTRKYDNVLVVQTYSKSRSLAGLRIGYAIGNKELIKAMNDVKYSYNSYTMNEPSIVLGTAVLEDEEYFQETRNKIIDTREWFQIEMRKIGFSFADSKAGKYDENNKAMMASVSWARLSMEEKEEGYKKYYFMFTTGRRKLMPCVDMMKTIKISI